MPATKYSYECTKDGSSKFWECWVDGKVFHARWGPIGQDPRSQQKPFPTEKEARIHEAKKIKEKIRKGYIHIQTTRVETLSEKIKKLRQIRDRKFGVEMGKSLYLADGDLSEIREETGEEDSYRDPFDKAEERGALLELDD